VAETTEEMLERLARLRDTFDHAFAEAPSTGAAQNETLLLMRVGGRPFVLRLAELAGFQRRRKMARLPGKRPHLLGLSGIRGKVVAVFDLASLVGCGHASEGWRWLALASPKELVGFACDEFEGYLQVPRNELYLMGEQKLRAVVSVGGEARGVVDLGSILTQMGNAVGGVVLP
jgi:purine-binding chemotaxis protein CheW